MSKLDTDILFDSGDAELKPGAERMLSDLARVLRSPEADGLKIMVVGHTDSQGVGKKPVREKFGDNFQISTARAVAVADRLKKEGVPEAADRRGGPRRIATDRLQRHAAGTREEPPRGNLPRPPRNPRRRLDRFDARHLSTIKGRLEKTSAV